MSEVKQIIQEAKILSNCEVSPPSGLPKVRASDKLPRDLKEFYVECGGMLLFNDSDYSYRILPSVEFQSANLVILGEEVENDITHDWYTIVSDGNGDFITIDLHSDRLGRCYESFHETYGMVGETPIIALSFTELLQKLFHNKGQRCYWLDDCFHSLGDAYDDQ